MNRICELFEIQYPIVQGGMIWCSGWELASAVSNAGGLGLIGSGSMYPDVLRTHIHKTKQNTDKPFGVNVPLIYPNIEEIMQIIIEEGVKIVFTSAGNPKAWTKQLQSHGIKVAHVIANSRFAAKCDEAGVDAIVAEGFEAGGHNGREETTTMVLIPSARKATDTPLIAAGGIGSGSAMLAAMALGADGVQIGSRFAASNESSAHQNFKDKIVEAVEGSTKLTLKQLIPVRLIRNKFLNEVEAAEQRGATSEELKELLGHARAKKGMFEGDVDDGEMEIGQVSGIIDKLQPVDGIMKEIIDSYRLSLNNLCAGNKSGF
ncbi:MAG: nitronate monooxygenase [Bacteroidales bacterium]|nr:nitronate monooxygenase [Bacteroidales bacterium]MCF8458287.1 nitronate monooxygenase [Bacteroidales bacterium]